MHHISGTVSIVICYDEAHKALKEKDAVKNAWDSIARVLEFVPNGIIFIFTL